MADSFLRQTVDDSYRFGIADLRLKVTVVLTVVGEIWEKIRGSYVAPVLQVAINVCLVMLVMLFVERVYMSGVLLIMKLLKKTPERRLKFEPIKDDVELGSSIFSTVLIQIPMYNEKEVYKLSIGAACGLRWPSDRFIVQVLDDSTDPLIKNMVEMECQKWAAKGINIKYEVRDNRNGYKAGALKEGLKRSYAADCDYVAIFDADFQPDPEFLRLTIPFLNINPQLGLVQARWKFVNADECIMTRLQEISLDYHFQIEQQVGSCTFGFFGFNGTAGVWRLATINEAGGWQDRTTVEDMDLAVRASLKGWQFVYLNDLSVKNELPSTFKAFRNQQHRWSCGPASLFRKILPYIWFNKTVNFWKKIHMIYSFFVVRKVIAHIVTFTFFCAVLPTSVLVPEVYLPDWGSIYLPSIITLLNATTTPRSLHLIIFWVPFENVMSLLRTKATIIGLLDLGRVNEWIVTEKLGSTLKAKDSKPKVIKKTSLKIIERFNTTELLLAMYLFFCASYNLNYGTNLFYFYLYLQSIAFFVAGIGYVGVSVPS